MRTVAAFIEGAIELVSLAAFILTIVTGFALASGQL